MKVIESSHPDPKLTFRVSGPTDLSVIVDYNFNNIPDDGAISNQKILNYDFIPYNINQNVWFKVRNGEQFTIHTSTSYETRVVFETDDGQDTQLKAVQGVSTDNNPIVTGKHRDWETCLLVTIS